MVGSVFFLLRQYKEAEQQTCSTVCVQRVTSRPKVWFILCNAPGSKVLVKWLQVHFFSPMGKHHATHHSSCWVVKSWYTVYSISPPISTFCPPKTKLVIIWFDTHTAWLLCRVSAGKTSVLSSVWQKSTFIQDDDNPVLCNQLYWH